MHNTALFRSKKDIVYDFLYNAILKDEFRPGSRLVIDDLASRLGVSQIPIREALQKLQADGFVAIEPYVGARVTEIDTGLIDEIFDLLEALEVISTCSACQKMTPADFEAFEQLLQEMDKAVDDASQFSQENMRLHQFICDCAGMALVKNLLSQVFNHWNRLRFHYLGSVSVQNMHTSQQEHWHLLKAMQTQDPVYVEQIIREHNHTARQIYAACMPKAMT